MKQCTKERPHPFKEKNRKAKQPLSPQVANFAITCIEKRDVTNLCNCHDIAHLKNENNPNFK